MPGLHKTTVTYELKGVPCKSEAKAEQKSHYIATPPRNTIKGRINSKIRHVNARPL